MHADLPRCTCSPRDDRRDRRWADHHVGIGADCQQALKSKGTLIQRRPRCSTFLPLSLLLSFFASFFAFLISFFLCFDFFPFPAIAFSRAARQTTSTI